MKAVPKVNTDGLYIEDTLVDDAFSGVVPFYAAPKPDLPPETDPDAAGEQREASKSEIAGYIVGIPVPPGLYLPRFNLEVLHGGELTNCWSEGLTQEQIEALSPPKVETDAEKIARLEQENKLLAAQNAANADRMEFIEDVLAEMALNVYE